MNLIRFFLSVIISCFFLGCVPSKKVSKKTISHNYYNISFAPEQIQKPGLANVEVTITPIDAASINPETSEAARRDGNYEKELAFDIERRKVELQGLSKAEKAYINGKINAIDAVSKLEKENLIPSNTSYQLRHRIWYEDKDIDARNGTEVTSLSDVETYSDNFNPYKINKKYLSIFKVTFENKGSEIEKIKLKELQVVSGEELLYPLGVEYFENNLKEEPEKIKNAYRMNMPEELVLTPSQRITKYLAIPAINPKNENLQIQIIKGKEIVNFDFKVREKAESKNYLLESYDIYSSGIEEPLAYKLYYAVNYQNGVSFATLDSRIFVSEEKVNSLVSIYVVAINMSNSKVRTAQKVNFRFNEEEKNLVVIPFERNRRFMR